MSPKHCILVVENEPLIRFDAVDFFECAGFVVEEAGDAETALQILRLRPEIRVLFTDVHMPGPMDGLALARTAARDHRHVSLIIVSGREPPEAAALPDRAVFFPKPYEAWRIVAQVHAMLPRPNPTEKDVPMSNEMIVAIYDTPAHAGMAASDLRQAGVPEAAIEVHAGKISAANTGHIAAPREPGFWSSLFGGTPDHDVGVYERSVDNGASVISVRTPDAYVTRVLEILESHAPIDIDERAIELGQAGASPDGENRVVNRGDSRIRRFVAER